MKSLRAILTELFGLFLDDGPLAATSLLWIATVALVSKCCPLPPAIAGAALLAGAIICLLASVWRAAASSRQTFKQLNERSEKPSVETRS